MFDLQDVTGNAKIDILIGLFLSSLACIAFILYMFDKHCKSNKNFVELDRNLITIQKLDENIVRVAFDENIIFTKASFYCNNKRVKAVNLGLGLCNVFIKNVTEGQVLGITDLKVRIIGPEKRYFDKITIVWKKVKKIFPFCKEIGV